jgi:hypothetical protein
MLGEVGRKYREAVKDSEKMRGGIETDRDRGNTVIHTHNKVQFSYWSCYRRV